MEYDQVARHDVPDVVKGIRDIERQNAVEPMPNNCDPMGAIRGRGRMYEGIAGGNYKGWALAFAWFYFGTPAIIGYVFALSAITSNFSQSARNYPGSGDGLAIMLLASPPDVLSLSTMAGYGCMVGEAPNLNLDLFLSTHLRVEPALSCRPSP